MKIVELEGKMVEISRQKWQLEPKVDGLEQLLKLKSEMVFRGPVYFHDSDRTPFCPKCFEKDARPIHLVN
jgi:hypothetical protein